MEDGTGEDGLWLEAGTDGMAALVFDQPGSRVNLLSRPVLDRLDLLLDEVSARAAAGTLRALVVRSDKAGSFNAGIDLREVWEAEDSAEAAAYARRGQRLFRRLENLPLPTISVIDGGCLGAGLELALACGYRLASASPRTLLAFPEVQLGIIPAFGGTVRLPRLIGTRTALELIVSGRTIHAPEAHRLGIVDAVFAEDDLAEGVIRFAGDRLRQGRLRRGSRRGIRGRLLEDTAPGRRVVFARMEREIRGFHLGRAEAARRALEVIADGLALPLEQAFEREAQALGELIVTREAKGLLHDHRLRRAARVLAPAGRSASTPTLVAVLGAGPTGAGIAHLLARSGISVRLREIAHPPLRAGLQYIQALFARDVALAIFPRSGLQARAAEISGTLGFGGFGMVEMVVDATPETLEGKSAILQEVEEHVRDDCVLATCSGRILLSELAGGLRSPSRLVGLNFFHPAARNGLVEVVRGSATGPAAIAAACALARRTGKTPLVVADTPGFLVTRVVTAYIAEARQLLAEGATALGTDAEMQEFGMSVGPFRLARDLGLPAISNDPPASRTRTESPSEAEVRSRMLLVMLNEAARALADGVVATAAEVDLAVTLVLGFPTFRGGLLYHVDRMGISNAVRTLEGFAESLGGDRFIPAPLLLTLAAEGSRFYDLLPWEAASGQRPGEMLT